MIKIAGSSPSRDTDFYLRLSVLPSTCAVEIQDMVSSSILALQMTRLKSVHNSKRRRIIKSLLKLTEISGSSLENVRYIACRFTRSGTTSILTAHFPMILTVIIFLAPLFSKCRLINVRLHPICISGLLDFTTFRV